MECKLGPISCVMAITQSEVFVKFVYFSKNLYFCLLDNVSGRIECKLGPISNVMSISHSEEL